MLNLINNSLKIVRLATGLFFMIGLYTLDHRFFQASFILGLPGGIVGHIFLSRNDEIGKADREKGVKPKSINQFIAIILALVGGHQFLQVWGVDHTQYILPASLLLASILVQILPNIRGEVPKTVE